MVIVRLGRSIVLAGILLHTAQADDCSVKPLVLPIRNVTFPSGIGANRGIKIVLGGQIQGVRMSTITNNTRVRNILDCPSNSTFDLIACQGASGSVYSTTAGSFKQVFNLDEWKVSVVDAQPNDGSATVVQGYDIADFADGPAVIPDYPLEVWADHDSLNLSALALGPKSSTLERFVQHGLAPSSTFSIDFGSRSELFPRDGQVVFGGVNEARFDPKTKAEFPMWGAAASVNCPLQVLLSDVILTNADGDHSLFEDPDSKVSACIDTIQNSFSLTASMFAKFQALGRHIDSDGSTYGAQSYPADREPLIGTLTIRLANGYTSVIPHYELVTHERGTDSQGKYAVVNNSRIQTGVAAGQSDLGANIPILGGVFLSQNYLHVDYANSKFWLSPQVANGTLPDRITTACNSTAAQSAQASAASSLALKVCLPILACVIIAGLGVWLFMRRRKRRAFEQSADAGAGARGQMLDVPSLPTSKSSTSRFGDYASQYPSELQGEDWQASRQQGGAQEHGSPAAPAYSAQFAGGNRYEKQGSQYGSSWEGDSYEMPDTSRARLEPSLSRRTVDSQQRWDAPSRHGESFTVSEMASPSSMKEMPIPVSR